MRRKCPWNLGLSYICNGDIENDVENAHHESEIAGKIILDFLLLDHRHHNCILSVEWEKGRACIAIISNRPTSPLHLTGASFAEFRGMGRIQ